jgi:ABC-type transport system substrate-binding protein
MPKVTKNGKVYDFTVKANFTKLSNGEAVTAANFKAAIDRIPDPKMNSPAIGFISDIVGSDASPVSGVTVRGNHLIIRLTKAAPDFLARIAMPFSGAVPKNLPHDPNGVDAPPSAGPYYIASRTATKAVLLKRNPYYKGKRPHNLDAVSYSVGNSLEAIRLRVEQATSDYAADGLPPAAWSELAAKYGVNKGRVWVKPALSDPTYNKKMLDAALLAGPKRYTTYGLLDIDLMKNAAPIAPRAPSNGRVFVSNRFGCFTYNNVYGVDIAAACLK